MRPSDGAKGPDEMELVPVNEEAEDICECIEEELCHTSGPGYKEYGISSNDRVIVGHILLISEE